jgi:predicted flap endonuclease-1-like 5' DNA nuclease
MKTAENKNAPNLAGWAIGVAMGAVAFAVAKIVGELSTPASVAIGAIVALLAGMVMGMPWGARVAAAPKPAMPKAAAKPAAVAVEVPQAAPAPKPAPTPKPKPAPAPVAAAPVAVMATPAAAKRPEALKAARGGKADDLKIIKGIGPKLEILCHKLGFFHFDQVAGWKDDEISWVDENLEGFKGRVTRDRWVPQAKAIVKLGPAEFLKRLDAGEEF